MYSSSAALILFVILIIGTILQLIGLFTIGWHITTNKIPHTSTYEGLWFYRSCDELDNCKTRSYYDEYQDYPYNYYSAAYYYSHYVGPQVKAVLSVVFCLVSTVLSCLIYRDHALKLRFCILNACLLLVSGTLIWTVIGTGLAVIAVAVSMDNTNFDVKFPYSMFLSALGSSSTVLVGFINIVALFKENFGRSEMRNQNNDYDLVLM